MIASLRITCRNIKSHSRSAQMIGHANAQGHTMTVLTFAFACIEDTASFWHFYTPAFAAAVFRLHYIVMPQFNAFCSQLIGARFQRAAFRDASSSIQTGMPIIFHCVMPTIAQPLE